VRIIVIVIYSDRYLVGVVVEVDEAVVEQEA
jgi:hypothetical protein